LFDHRLQIEVPCVKIDFVVILNNEDGFLTIAEF